MHIECGKERDGEFPKENKAIMQVAARSPQEEKSSPTKQKRKEKKESKRGCDAAPVLLAANDHSIRTPARHFIHSTNAAMQLRCDAMRCDVCVQNAAQLVASQQPRGSHQLIIIIPKQLQNFKNRFMSHNFIIYHFPLKILNKILLHLNFLTKHSYKSY